MTEPAAHHAEAFIIGYGINKRWGWHCLSCDAERFVPTLAEAEAGADAHMRCADADLVAISLTVCSQCIAGVGGECHTPGCDFWMGTAPDEELSHRLLVRAVPGVVDV